VQDSIAATIDHEETAKNAVCESEADYVTTEAIYEIECDMIEAARSLQFERAAALRDRILELDPSWKGGFVATQKEHKRKGRGKTTRAGRSRGRKRQ